MHSLQITPFFKKDKHEFQPGLRFQSEDIWLSKTTFLEIKYLRFFSPSTWKVEHNLPFYVGNIKSRMLALLMPRKEENLRRSTTTLFNHVGENKLS